MEPIPVPIPGDDALRRQPSRLDHSNILNPSQELQEILRATKLDIWLLMRGATT